MVSFSLFLHVLERYFEKLLEYLLGIGKNIFSGFAKQLNFIQVHSFGNFFLNSFGNW